MIVILRCLIKDDKLSVFRAASNLGTRLIKLVDRLLVIIRYYPFALSYVIIANLLGSNMFAYLVIINGVLLFVIIAAFA